MAKGMLAATAIALAFAAPASAQAPVEIKSSTPDAAQAVRDHHAGRPDDPGEVSGA